MTKIEDKKIFEKAVSKVIGEDDDFWDEYLDMYSWRDMFEIAKEFEKKMESKNNE